MSELDLYDYHLPRELIAQNPTECRTNARMLVIERESGRIRHQHVADLHRWFMPGDCLVLNDTRVIPARLYGTRTETGGRWEGLFLETDETDRLWRLMGTTRGKLREGETVTLLNVEGRDDFRLEMTKKMGDGTWVATPLVEGELENASALTLLERVGRIPLPPYIRDGQMMEEDRDRYQTIYAERPGAIAAPTAGLHFTEELLERIAQRDVTIARVTLHVGQGTFKPIETGALDEHVMHSEWGELTPETAEQLNACRAAGGRIFAIGTTSVRVLETAGAHAINAEAPIPPFQGDTDLFIRPPYKFRAVDCLMTNFHLPRTTLLVLISAFAGREKVLEAYQEAIENEYRFYSYGDSMLIV